MSTRTYLPFQILLPGVTKAPAGMTVGQRWALALMEGRSATAQWLESDLPEIQPKDRNSSQASALSGEC